MNKFLVGFATYMTVGTLVNVYQQYKFKKRGYVESHGVQVGEIHLHGTDVKVALFRATALPGGCAGAICEMRMNGDFHISIHEDMFHNKETFEYLVAHEMTHVVQHVENRFDMFGYQVNPLVRGKIEADADASAVRHIDSDAMVEAIKLRLGHLKLSVWDPTNYNNVNLAVLAAGLLARKMGLTKQVEEPYSIVMFD